MMCKNCGGIMVIPLNGVQDPRPYCRNGKCVLSVNYICRSCKCECYTHYRSEEHSWYFCEKDELVK